MSVNKIRSSLIISGLSRGISHHVVSVLTGIICHIVVVLRGLCSITLHQGQYDESLQMHRRAHDILTKTSPESEELAAGRHWYYRMSDCHRDTVVLCSVLQYGWVLYEVIAI